MQESSVLSNRTGVTQDRVLGSVGARGFSGYPEVWRTGMKRLRVDTLLLDRNKQREHRVPWFIPPIPSPPALLSIYSYTSCFRTAREFSGDFMSWYTHPQIPPFTPS